MTKSEVNPSTPSAPTTTSGATNNNVSTLSGATATSVTTSTTTPTTGSGGMATSTNASASANSTSSNMKTLPRDSAIITSILKDMGIVDYEPRVVHQLLEFAYRYVTTVLEDAQVFSQYANKKVINADDVKLAIQLQVDKMFTSPPPRDSLMEIARQKNNQPLPPIKSHAGPRLPPDRYSLIACNYRLKKSSILKGQQQQQSLASNTGSSTSKFTLPFRTITTGQPTLIIGNRSTPVISLPARSSTAGTTTISAINNINNLGGSGPIITEIKSVSQLEKESEETGVKRKLEHDDID